MYTYKTYEVEGVGIEIVSPFLLREDRVSLIPDAKLADWQPVLDTLKVVQQPVHTCVHGAEPVVPALPHPVHAVTKSNHGWQVDGKRAPGITAQIARRLRGRFKQYLHYRKYTKTCVGVGIAVDKELKQFAVGDLPFNALENDSKAVVEYLFSRDISLVASGVLVSNWHEGVKNHCSATEVDLVGFDHIRRKLVVVELKVTSSSFQEMKCKLKRARRDKSGFRKCVLGRYIAQVFLTLKMFRNTYSYEADGILVMVEHRNSRVFNIDMGCTDYKQNAFESWIAGY